MSIKDKKINNSDSSDEEIIVPKKEHNKNDIQKLNDEKEKIEKDIKKLNDKKEKIEKGIKKLNDKKIKQKKDTKIVKKSNEIDTQKEIITKEQIISLFKKILRAKNM